MYTCRNVNTFIHKVYIKFVYMYGYVLMNIHASKYPKQEFTYTCMYIIRIQMHVHYTLAGIVVYTCINIPASNLPPMNIHKIMLSHRPLI